MKTTAKRGSSINMIIVLLLASIIAFAFLSTNENAFQAVFKFVNTPYFFIGVIFILAGVIIGKIFGIVKNYQWSN